MLKQLIGMGVNFDCASLSEIKTVMRLGVTPDRIIFANPCKLPSHIAFARTARVKMMTFDNEDELRKIKKIFPGARLVLRIATDDSAATHSRLSTKFGAKEAEWGNLIKVAKDLKLRLIGVRLVISIVMNSFCLVFMLVAAVAMPKHTIVHYRPLVEYLIWRKLQVLRWSCLILEEDSLAQTLVSQHSNRLQKL